MNKYENLLNTAKEASEKAYAPYSNFKVGAALLLKDKTIIKGANVENASYGLSLCAERNAVSTAIAQGLESGIEAIAIYSPNIKNCSPCGACRQWLWEFEDGQDIKIILENEDGSPLVTSITALLPMGFKLH